MMKRWALPLTVEMLRGRMRLMEPLLDLLSAPIAKQACLLLIAGCLPVAWLRLYALGAFLVLALHITAAAASGPGGRGMIRTLAAVPGYLLWKLWILPEVWRASRAETLWVRTARETPGESE